MLAYATTIHKSQGSEYAAVVIPLTTQHYTMLQRNLLYTGVTRGKRLVVLVGQRQALAIAVKGSQTRRRWSKLGEWLEGRCQPILAADIRSTPLFPHHIAGDEETNQCCLAGEKHRRAFQSALAAFRNLTLTGGVGLLGSRGAALDNMGRLPTRSLSRCNGATGATPHMAPREEIVAFTRNRPIAMTKVNCRGWVDSGLGIEPQTHISRHERTLGRH